MTADTLSRKTTQISALLEARLSLRGKTLEQKAGKVGRQLPRGVRSDLAQVVRADVVQGHPKLRHMVDARRVELAADRVVTYLKGIDPKEVRKTRVLRTLAKWAALGLAVFIGVIWYLWSQGRI